MRIYENPAGKLNLVVGNCVTPVPLQVMCVLMVCFNVLELLLDETAMPRGMEVKKLAARRLLWKTVFSAITEFCVLL